MLAQAGNRLPPSATCNASRWRVGRRRARSRRRAAPSSCSARSTRGCGSSTRCPNTSARYAEVAIRAAVQRRAGGARRDGPLPRSRARPVETDGARPARRRSGRCRSTSSKASCGSKWIASPRRATPTSAPPNSDRLAECVDRPRARERSARRHDWRLRRLYPRPRHAGPAGLGRARGVAVLAEVPSLKPEVLEALAEHGLRPRRRHAGGAPARTDQRPLSLRDPAAARSLPRRRVHDQELPARVVELRKRYLLLSIPIERWPLVGLDPNLANRVNSAA